MRVLISDDDPISRRLLEATLRRTGYDVVQTENGRQALDVLEEENAPKLAILDWIMPEMDGIEVCRRIRHNQSLSYTYIVLLSSKGKKDELAEGFKAGVDDYLIKPFDPIELRSRLAVGERLINLQEALETKVRELQTAHKHVTQLQGLIPICMHCKKIRDDESTWHRLETYIQEHSQAMFTHSLCNECLVTHYPEVQSNVLASREEK